MSHHDIALEKQEAREKIIREQKAKETEEVNKKKRDEDRSRRIDILDKIAKKLRAKKRGGMQMPSNEEWDRILRTKDLHIFIFSTVGLLASIFLSYYKWSQRCFLNQDLLRQNIAECIYDPDGAYARANPDQTKVTATIANTQTNLQGVWAVMLSAQFVLSFSTFICCFGLFFQYYGLRVKERRREWSGLSEIDLIESTGRNDGKKEKFKSSYSIWRSNLRIEFVIEFMLHFIHPVLWIETMDPADTVTKGWQTFYEVTECVVFLRLYLLLRLMYISSSTYVFRADIINSNKELQRYGYRVTASSTFKIMFYNNPGAMVALLVTVSIGIFGFWIFVIERNGNSAFAELWDCYWFVWVSISTIGYGDMSATSATGRVIVIIIAAASLFIMTIFSGIVTNLLSPTKEQKYVAGYLDQQEADLEYRKAAVDLIVVVHREKKARAQARNQASFYDGKRTPEVYRAIKRVKRARLALRESLGSAADPVVDIKLQRAVVLAKSLNDLLDAQAEQIIKLEDRITWATSIIRQRGTMKRRVASVGGRRSSSSGRSKRRASASGPSGGPGEASPTAPRRKQYIPVDDDI